MHLIPGEPEKVNINLKIYSKSWGSLVKSVAIVFVPPAYFLVMICPFPTMRSQSYHIPAVDHEKLPPLPFQLWQFLALAFVGTVGNTSM